MPTDKEIVDQVIAKSLEDDQFKNRFIDDPKGVLREAGMEVRDELSIKVLQASPTEAYVILPSPMVPSNELFEEDLLSVTGGATTLEHEDRCAGGYTGTPCCSGA